MTLYFAYGSNLNIKQMKVRCPKATILGRFTLDDTRLVFRGVADVIMEAGAKCQGGIWRITPECEAALDRYEGFDPRAPERGMYRKVYLPIDGISGETELMLYQMNSTGIMPPSHYYLDSIKQGYRDFGLKMKPLLDAVEASHDDKAPSHIERQRRARTGRPPLAQRPSEAKRKPKKETRSQRAHRLNEQQKDKKLAQSDLFRRAMTVYGD